MGSTDLVLSSKFRYQTGMRVLAGNSRSFRDEGVVDEVPKAYETKGDKGELEEGCSWMDKGDIRSPHGQ